MREVSGVIAEWLDGLSHRLRMAVRHSRLITSFSKSCDSGRMERWEDVRCFHHRMLAAVERSRLLGAWQDLFRIIREGSLSNVGLFLATAGGVTLGGRLLQGQGSVAELWLPLGLLLVAAPLLSSQRAVGRAILSSLLLSSFFLGFCGFSRDSFAAPAKESLHRGGALFFGLAAGVLSVLLSPQTVLLGCFLLIAVSIAMALPELALVLLLLCTPVIALTQHPTTVLSVCLVALFLLLLPKLFTGKRQLSFSAADLAVGLSAVLWSVSGGMGVAQAILLLGGWFPARWLTSSAKWRGRCLAALSLSATGVSALGIWQYLAGEAQLKWVDLTRFGDIGGRVCGVFENPNVLASYLLLTVPLTLIWAVSASSVWGGVLGALGFGAGSLCLLLTWSRGAWLGWIFSTVLFFMCYSRRSLSVCLAGLLPTAALASWLPGTVLRRFASIFGRGDSSIRYRVDTWRGVWRMLAAHPAGIGCGDEVFHRVYPLYAVSGTESVMHAHQIWLQLAVELGIVGAMLVACQVLMILRCGAWGCRCMPPGRGRGALLAMLASLVGALTMGVFDHIWYHKLPFWIFWCLCAMLWSLVEGREWE